MSRMDVIRKEYIRGRLKVVSGDMMRNFHAGTQVINKTGGEPKCTVNSTSCYTIAVRY
jgi:hypothetical protein